MRILASTVVIAAALASCGGDSDDDGSDQGAGGGGGEVIVGPGGSGSGSAGAPASECFDYGSFVADTPEVSFFMEVLPVLRQSCGLSAACHGDMSSPAGYLGPPLSVQVTPQEIDAIFAANVGVAATLEPGMSRVEAGNPAESFLMHKLDGTFECPVLECGATMTCGDVEPQGGGLLPAPIRDVIRRWIAQGAAND